MDMYGIGAMSMQMSAVQTQYQAAVSVMKMGMDMPEMAMNALLGDMTELEAGAEAAVSGLGQFVDITA